MSPAQQGAMVAVLVGALSALAVAALVMACGGAEQGPTQVATQAEVIAYGAEQQECVALAATKQQADDCIAEVRARWCGTGGQLALRGACGDSGIAALREAGGQ
jgi:hypothetical protein